MEFFNKYKDLFEIPQVKLKVFRGSGCFPQDYDSITTSSYKKPMFPLKRRSTPSMENFGNSKKIILSLNNRWMNSQKCDLHPNAVNPAKAKSRIVLRPCRISQIKTDTPALNCLKCLNLTGQSFSTKKNCFWEIWWSVKVGYKMSRPIS